MRWGEGAELKPAPRGVPWSVRTRLCSGGAGTKVACFIGVIGLTLSAFRFSPTAVWHEIQLSAGHVYVMVTTTGWSESGTYVNEMPIVANHYEYEVNNQTYENVSYLADNDLEAGSPVKIKVKPNSPLISVMEGARTTQASLFILVFLLCMLLITVLTLLYTFQQGLKHIRLLKYGVETEGVVVESTRTAVSVNDHYVYKVVIEYTGIDGKEHQLKTPTHDVEALTDEPEETILMHPTKTGVAIPIDILPDYVHLTRNGEFSNGSVLGITAAIANLVIPLGALILLVILVTSDSDALHGFFR